MGEVTQGRYKDQDAVVIENADLRAVILPRWGAKLASLRYKRLDAEMLWQNPAPAYAPTKYGDSYPDGEMAGFDEMFPTISRCFYEDAPWAGTELPDHGEVWSVPWEHEVRGEAVTLRVHGPRLPYRLEKTVSLSGRRLLSSYRAVNLSPFPMQFLWAAHPLFNTVEGMRFIVPSGMRRVINSVAGPTLPGYGQSYSFPVARRADGSEVRLDRVPARNPSGWQKYWFAGKVTEGWCALHDPLKKLSLGLEFPKETVPYLGMWLNDGGFGGQYNIAPEPATAAMDRTDLSRLWDMGSVLAPGTPYEWHLAITLAEGGEPCGMNGKGEFVY
jgi:galactose mutarotase-like enzyme